MVQSIQKNGHTGEEGKKPLVCVLMGGLSSEREVSLSSGKAVYEGLQSKTAPSYPAYRAVLDDVDELPGMVSRADIVFNCLHGGIGEDGTVQALLEVLGVPYTGSGPLASVRAMDKVLSKQAFRNHNIPVPNFLVLDSNEELGPFIKQVYQDISLPAVVKPASEGSSVGVKIVRDENSLSEAVRKAREEYGRVIVENYIPGLEVTAGVLEIEDRPTPLPLIELDVVEEPFYNYQAKYTPGETRFVIPANLPSDISEDVQRTAVASHQALGCRGYSRVDFRVNVEAGEFCVLEINSLPGMTETSDLPKAAAEKGIEFPELLHLMLDSAERRREEFSESKEELCT